MKRQLSLALRQYRHALLTIGFVLFCLFVKGGAAWSQDYHYRFQLQGIEESGSAKEITDILRSIFNTPEEPFVYFPNFNDETNMFDFHSGVSVSQAYLESQLTPLGITVLNFEATADGVPELAPQ